MPILPIEALQNISNVAKAALDTNVLKNQAGAVLDPRSKGVLWTQIAQFDEYIQELRKAEASAAPPTG